MDAAKHADSCFQQFGKSFYDVHRFLDQYWDRFPGYSHRRVLHHRLGVDLIVERFGEAARAPAELHIRQDTGGVLPDDWSYYDEPVDIEVSENQGTELRRLYGDQVFETIESNPK